MNRITGLLPHLARILLGLPFFVGGLNGFLEFAPMPELTEPAAAFMGALVQTGYLLPLVKAIELLTGLALLGNRFVPLALVLLAPIMVNIVTFHVFLTPGDVAMPVVLLALQLFLAWSYRDAYGGVLRARSTPRVGATASAPEVSPQAA
ncbi:MAG: DoxX family protein [Myxococcales bacterium]|nr:DoxX family protein [Myxococcales bacterium]MCB9645045.1 DoxX family protein [Deltaproteobacteria bacterium]